MEQPRLRDVDQLTTGWLKKYQLYFDMPDGGEMTYDAVSRKDEEAYRETLERLARGEQDVAHTDAVCIVPRTASGRVVLIREFRYPLNGWCVAFPAGLIEAGEEIASTVERELREETGYRLARAEDGTSKLRILPRAGFSSAGMTEESVQVVFAEVEEEPDAAETEATEFIEVFTLEHDEIADFLQSSPDLISVRAQLILDGMVH